MLWGGLADGGLELRKRGSQALLRGRFPYNKAAVLSDGGRTGRPRKEVLASRAFSFRVELPEEDVHLLVGHDYGKPLASKAAGTLALRDRDDALTFEATITPEIAETTWARDAIAAVGAGLMIGLSPGFRIPPKRAVEKAEEVTEEAMRPEEGMHGALIRTIFAALLYELSLVTRPAYPEAQISARNWSPTTEAPDAGLSRAIARWR